MLHQGQTASGQMIIFQNGMHTQIFPGHESHRGLTRKSYHDLYTRTILRPHIYLLLYPINSKKFEFGSRYHK